MMQVIESLSLAIDQRDPYTARHQRGVSKIAVNIASDLGLPASQIEGVRIGGLLHDIGKNSIPTDILHKPTPLNQYDLETLQYHPLAGAEILDKINFQWPIAEMVRQHHERIDGSGYPYGLKGDEILLEARILAVADTIEAATEERPYRPAKGLAVALEEIRTGSGVQFDSNVVDAALRIYQEINVVEVEL